ncbi:hypothetical protein BDF14DRAFT_1849092 [Spinellus fusiger]|nr:hypothetical protein BDF14DRAFT_1849092 [Spinellus fusiger]
MPPTPHSHTENDTFFSSRKSIRSFHSGKSGRSIKNSIKSTMQKATRNFTPASSLSESSKRSSLGFNTSKFTKKEKRPRAYSYTSFANAHFPNNNVHVEPLPLPVALPVTSIHAVTSASSSSKSTQRNSFGHTFSKLLKKEGSNRAKVPPFADLVLPPPVPQTSVDYFSPQPKTEMPSPLKTYTPESFKADAPESLKADTTGSTKKKFGSRLKKLFTKK